MNWSTAAALVLITAAVPAAPAPPRVPVQPARRESSPLAASATLLSRVQNSGRAEASVTTVVDGRTQRGRIALEPPRYARIDLEDGERLTLHGDGGEWLQPRHRQVVHAGGHLAREALRWWSALVDPRGWSARRVASGVWDLDPPDSLGEGTARVWLDRHGLPSRLRVTSGDEAREYRLSGWRFVPARGARAFVLETPPGYEDVSMP